MDFFFLYEKDRILKDSFSLLEVKENRETCNMAENVDENVVFSPKEKKRETILDFWVVFFSRIQEPTMP